MEWIRNPFSPGAGTPPPELAGREEVLEQGRVLFGRVRAGRPEKSLLLTGLRGVGKTVLLGEMERMAQADGYRTVALEAQEGRPLPLLLVPPLRRALFELDRMAGAGDRARRALAVLKSFVGAIRVTVGEVEFGLDIDPERGAADSGDLSADLPELFAAVADAARERSTAVALFIDELQYCSEAELKALIVAMHRLQQKQLPLVLVAAGLPTLPGLAGEAKSYAERLFAFPPIGPLAPPDARTAVGDPIRSAGESIAADALDEIVTLTGGYPYFLQEWGYQVWNLAPASPVRLDTVRLATDVVTRRLDENFFRVRFDRLTGREKRYLRAMAELGPGPYRTGDVAARLRARVTSLAHVRAALIRKGMIYSPGYGEMAFTVPLFDGFLRRVLPEFA